MRSLLTILFISFWFISISQTVNDLRPTVTMKEYVDMQDAMNREMDEVRANNLESSTDKALASLDKRLDGMNEFRQTLQDSNKTYITKSELFAWVMALLMAFFAYANYMRNKPKKETEIKN